MDTTTGEILQDKTIRSWVVERVDNEQFTKLYDKYLQVIFGLSPRALKMFQYFVTALKFNDEQVFFELKAAKMVTGYTSKYTIFIALAELIDAQIIARSSATNIYYINPKIFVKGNRIDMMQTWVGNHKPILTTVVPFYKRWWLRRRMNMPTPIVVGGSAFSEIYSIA
jgi:hypothetical protein